MVFLIGSNYVIPLPSLFLSPFALLGACQTIICVLHFFGIYNLVEFDSYNSFYCQILMVFWFLYPLEWEWDGFGLYHVAMSMFCLTIYCSLLWNIMVVCCSMNLSSVILVFVVLCFMLFSNASFLGYNLYTFHKFSLMILLRTIYPLHHCEM